MADEANNQVSFPSSADKEYPLCPEGSSKVIVARALLVMKKKPAKFLNEGEDPNKEYPHVQLMLQTDKKYKDGDIEKNNNVFYTMKVSDHKKATLVDFFKSVLGIDIPLSPEKTITFVTNKEMTEDSERMHLPQFENLEFDVVVKHRKSEDGSKTFDNVDSVFASPEQKALNAHLFSAK